MKFIRKKTGDNSDFSPFREEQRKRTASILKPVLLTVSVMQLLYILVRDLSEGFVFTLNDLYLIISTVVFLISYIMLKRNFITSSAIIAISAAMTGMTLMAIDSEGVRDMAVVSFLILIFLTTLMLGRTGTIVTTLVALFSTWILVHLQNKGIIVPDESTANADGRDFTLLLLVAASLSIFYDGTLKKYIAEINFSRTQYKDLNEELFKRNQQKKKINAELLIAKEKAEESDKLKTAFLTNMSHEIRTPMNGIIGFSELIATQELTKEEREEYSEIIVASCKQLLGVVNDILDISKIESGIIELHNHSFRLNSLLQDIFKINSLEAEKKGLALVLNLEIPEDVILEGDEQKIRQVMSNLVNNAIKFTREGSVTMGYEILEDCIRYYVKDTGIGIPKEEQGKIFNRFSQVSYGSKREFGGTGLGLSIAKAYIDKMGGSMHLISKQDKGSEFFFKLPLAKELADTLKSHQGIASEKAINVLLVEDVEINELLVLRLLKDYKTDISVARNGREALDIYRSGKQIDLIFMDIKLPDKSGYDIIEEIRKEDTHTYIIAQTAYALSADKLRLKEAGCNDFIPKPITKKNLDDAMKSFLSPK